MENNTYSYTPPQKEKPAKSKWVASALSIIPGLGHLYLEFPKQALEYFLLFVLTSSVIGFIGIGILSFLVLGLWGYGIYDAFTLCEKSTEDKGVDKNQHFSLITFWLNKHKKTHFKNISVSFCLAIGLIIIGTLIILNNVVMPTLVWLFHGNAFVINFIKNLFVALAFIASGAYIIIRKKEKPDYSKDAYYQSAYTTNEKAENVSHDVATATASTADVKTNVVIASKVDVSPLSAAIADDVKVPEMAKADDKDLFKPTSLEFTIEEK